MDDDDSPNTCCVDLPDGWLQYMSKSRNEPFLFHAKTKERLWYDDATLPDLWGWTLKRQKKMYVNLNVQPPTRTYTRPASIYDVVEEEDSEDDLEYERV
jgi:hypothetical protein